MALLPQNATVIVLEGEFDLAHREVIADALNLAVRCSVVIVDFAKATYIDSTVLSLLVKFRDTIDGLSNTLILTQVGAGVARLFDISQLGALFTMRPALADVLGELQVEPGAMFSITLVGDSPNRDPVIEQRRSGEQSANDFIATE